MRSLPRAAQIFVSVVVVLAVGVVLRAPLGGIDWWAFVCLAALFLVSQALPTSVQRASVVPSFAAALASVVLLGPSGAALVAACALFTVGSSWLVVQRVFNTAQYVLCAYGAGAAFLAFGGRPGPPGVGAYPHILIPFTAAALTYVLINTVLVGGILWLTRTRGERRRSRRVTPLVTLEVSYLAYAMFGLLIAAVWTLIGPLSILLVLVPIFVARWAFEQYVAQQTAYDATIASLCQAVETKDYYTRGHSERVSKASGMIAEEIRMRSDRVEAIKYAGMLHDVGKLGVPTTVLQKSGPLTEEDFAAIQLHPMRGLEIVREIGFLDEALAGIMHHHERLDGRGYPIGLAGSEIPEFARAIAVADAFDSMTSNRSYRRARTVESAIEELRRGAGTQFDPVMVDAFIRAVERHGWQRPAVVDLPEPGAVQTTQQDHDDPTAPLRVAEDLV